MYQFCRDGLLYNTYLSKEDQKLLETWVSKPGIVYGSSEYQKFNPPFWPAIVTSTYNLAKMFALIVKECTLNELTEHDSFLFCNEIRK